jgi:hypothetical protein
LASEVLPGSAADNLARLTGQLGGTSSSTEAADDSGDVEPEVILGHPTLRAPREVSLNEAMGTACWALTHAQSVLRREHGGIVDE